MPIQHILTDIQHALKSIEETSVNGGITDFKKQKQEGAKMTLKGAITQLLHLTKHDQDAHAIAKQLADSPLEEIPNYLDKLAEMVVDEKPVSFKVPNLPSDIKSEIEADLSEIQACMGAGCYRSAVILCGRIMETVLHRKYYDSTGIDLLEKAPGIGLGNLIAKLSDKGVQLDPGLPNQIHLINQVRVYSVHKKKDLFKPSNTQAEAILLYTLDILQKLFKHQNPE